MKKYGENDVRLTIHSKQKPKLFKTQKMFYIFVYWNDLQIFIDEQIRFMKCGRLAEKGKCSRWNIKKMSSVSTHFPWLITIFCFISLLDYGDLMAQIDTVVLRIILPQANILQIIYTSVSFIQTRDVMRSQVIYEHERC